MRLNAGYKIGCQQVHDQLRHGPVRSGNEMMTNMGNMQPSHSIGPRKEVKRKISPNRDINGPFLASSI